MSEQVPKLPRPTWVPVRDRSRLDPVVSSAVHRPDSGTGYGHA
jgi:hypothetical protein